MWKLTLCVTLEKEISEETEQSHTFKIAESLADGVIDVDHWEQAVRSVGFRTMRQLFSAGMQMWDAQVVAAYDHNHRDCQWVKRGRRDLEIRTLFGKVQVKRQRLRCRHCGRWVVPLTEQLEMGRGRATQGLQALAGLCAVHQPYGSAKRMVAEITQDENILCAKQIERMVKHEGPQVRQKEEEKRQQVSWEVIRHIQDQRPPLQQAVNRLYIGMDGIMVRSDERKGRWREGKVAYVCSDAFEPTGTKGRRITMHKRYVSSFESSDIFGSRVYATAVQMGARASPEVIVLSDGARWIRQVRRQCFRDAIFILDWYHLSDKIWKALRVSFPHDRLQRRQYGKPITDLFWYGQKEKALACLNELRQDVLDQQSVEVVAQQDGLDVLLSYVWNNWEGIIPYRYLQSTGYWIASSLVEKAADVVVAKRQKKRQGMHWSHEGADSVCALRTLWLNDDWDQYWQNKRAS